MTCVNKWLAMLFVLVPVATQAQDANTSQYDSIHGEARVAFRVNDASIRTAFGGNQQELDKITEMLRQLDADTTATMQRIVICGYGSPDGRYGFNDQLARKRTNSLKAYVAKNANLALNQIEVRYVAEDWEGVARFVEAASVRELPQRDAMLKVIKSDRKPDVKERILRKRFPAGFSYLKKHCLPNLRRSDYFIEYLTKMGVGGSNGKGTAHAGSGRSGSGAVGSGVAGSGAVVSGGTGSGVVGSGVAGSGTAGSSGSGLGDTGSGGSGSGLSGSGLSGEQAGVIGSGGGSDSLMAGDSTKQSVVGDAQPQTAQQQGTQHQAQQSAQHLQSQHDQAQVDGLRLWRTILAGLLILLLIALGFLIHRYSNELRKRDATISRMENQLNFYREERSRRMEGSKPTRNGVSATPIIPVAPVETPVVPEREEEEQQPVDEAAEEPQPVVEEPQPVEDEPQPVEEKQLHFVFAADEQKQEEPQQEEAQEAEALEEPEEEAQEEPQQEETQEENPTTTNLSEPSTDSDGQDQERFRKLDAIVMERKLFLDPDMNRETLMRIAGVDKNKLATMLKQYAGTNFAGYINTKRMEYALRLIKENPDYSTMKELAEACGYTSQSTFFRVFKAHYGITPAEFIQNETQQDKEVTAKSSVVSKSQPDNLIVFASDDDLAPNELDGQNEN